MKFSACRKCSLCLCFVVFNDKHFMARNFSRPKFMRIGCLQPFGENVAWSDAVMAGKF